MDLLQRIDEVLPVAKAITPGPWKLEMPLHDVLSIVVGDASYEWRFVADCHLSDKDEPTQYYLDDAEVRANAHAIAAIPKLYALLAECRDEIQRLADERAHAQERVAALMAIELDPIAHQRRVDAATCRSEAGKCADDAKGTAMKGMANYLARAIEQGGTTA